MKSDGRYEHHETNDRKFTREIGDECQRLIGEIDVESPEALQFRLAELAKRCAALPLGPSAAVVFYVLCRAALAIQSRVNRNARGDEASDLMRLLDFTWSRDRGVVSQTATAAVLTERRTMPAIVDSAVRAIARSSTEEHCHLHDVAKRLHISPFYLDRLLKRHTGQTFTQHMRTFRIRQSEALLRETNWSIKQIAAAVGFRRVSALDRAFRRVLRQSPTEYRREMGCR